MKTPLLVVCLLIPLPATPAAAAPLGSAFSYQGCLMDASQPAQGAYDFRFALLDAASGGHQVGPLLTNRNVAVNEGVFTTSVDFGPEPFSDRSLWIEIGVRPATAAGDFTVLGPRQPLLATPLSLYARTAGSATTAAQADTAATADSVSWTHLTDLPAGFADGVDNDTTYSAGKGLTLTATTFSVTPGGIGTNELADGAVLTARLANGAVTSNKIDWTTVGNALWQINGNAGTVPGTHFLGTRDNKALELRVNGERALRIEPGTDSSFPSLIGGASNNTLTNVLGAVISGGSSNRVNKGGDYGSIPGGASNVVSGLLAFAGGYRALATNSGSFVWADASNFDFATTRNNQFRVRAAGGAEFVTAIDAKGVATADLTLTSTGGVSIATATNLAPALELRRGYLKVTGATTPGSGAPVFIHRMTEANTIRDLACTIIDHPLCNGDPNAILMVTPNENPGDPTGGSRLQHYGPVSVFYTGTSANYIPANQRKWGIFFMNGLSAQPYIGAAYNVLVIKP